MGGWSHMQGRNHEHFSGKHKKIDPAIVSLVYLILLAVMPETEKNWGCQ